jgi:hypothetical protein
MVKKIHLKLFARFVSISRIPIKNVTEIASVEVIFCIHASVNKRNYAFGFNGCVSRSTFKTVSDPIFLRAPGTVRDYPLFTHRIIDVRSHTVSASRAIILAKNIKFVDTVLDFS